jgi:hypothetical protein
MNPNIEAAQLGTSRLQEAAASYGDVLVSFRLTLLSALWSSDQAGNLAVDSRLYWCAILFTRICCIAESVLALCPDESDAFSTTHWDFTSVASLTRNLVEATAFFYYFSAPVSKNEWSTRLLVMQLNDRTQRVRFFLPTHNQSEINVLGKEIAQFRAELSGNTFFQNLPEGVQKKLLEGNRPSIQTLREMARAFWSSDQEWSLYDFLSAQSHTLPMSFYRAAEQGRTGVENLHDKSYIAGVLPVARGILSGATETFRASFSKLVTFKPEPTGVDLLQVRNLIGKEDLIRDIKKVEGGVRLTLITKKRTKR